MEEGLERLKELIDNQIKLKKEFRFKRDKLEKLVDPITKHVKECCDWWEQNFPDLSEVIVMMDDETSLKIKKPTKEKCWVDTYLPYGIDFEECKIIDFNSYKKKK